MSSGNYPDFGHDPEKIASSFYRDRYMADVEAARAARLAGHKSLFRRLLDRLRPHRQEPVGDPESNYGTTNDPPR
jgi:hypothetical protein